MKHKVKIEKTGSKWSGERKIWVDGLLSYTITMSGREYDHDWHLRDLEGRLVCATRYENDIIASLESGRIF